MPHCPDVPFQADNDIPVLFRICSDSSIIFLCNPCPRYSFLTMAISICADCFRCSFIKFQIVSRDSHPQDSFASDKDTCQSAITHCPLIQSHWSSYSLLLPSSLSRLNHSLFEVHYRFHGSFGRISGISCSVTTAISFIYLPFIFCCLQYHTVNMFICK